jgi:hypothetical protein
LYTGLSRNGSTARSRVEERVSGQWKGISFASRFGSETRGPASAGRKARAGPGRYKEKSKTPRFRKTVKHGHRFCPGGNSDASGEKMTSRAIPGGRLLLTGIRVVRRARGTLSTASCWLEAAVARRIVSVLPTCYFLALGPEERGCRHAVTPPARARPHRLPVPGPRKIQGNPGSGQ